MGPVMNLLLAFVLTAVVLYQGAEVRSYEDQPPVVGVVAAGSPAARADIEPGDRIVSVADHRVDTWEQFFVSDRRAAEPRSQRSACCANGLDVTRKLTPVVAAGQSRFEIGDIGVLPNVHPHLRVGQRRRAGRARRPEGRRRHPGRRRQADDVPHEFREAIAKHPGSR